MTDQDLLAMAARARKAQEAINALGSGKPQPVVDEPPTAEEIAIVRKLRALYDGNRGAGYPSAEDLAKIDLKTVVPEFKGEAPLEAHTYSEMSLGEIITHLREVLPVTARVRLSDSIFSYRGYYDRPCVEPTLYVLNTRELADRLAAQVGNEMHGWKGGDYTISEDKLLHVAVEGDTGPSIIGFVPNSKDPNLYEPILLKESFRW